MNCSKIQYITVKCNNLQKIAVAYSCLQQFAVACNTLQYITKTMLVPTLLILSKTLALSFYEAVWVRYFRGCFFTSLVFYLASTARVGDHMCLSPRKVKATCRPNELEEEQ